MNPAFIIDIFEESNISYYLRDGSVLVRPIFKNITNGLNTIGYYEAHIWNILPNELKTYTQRRVCETNVILQYKLLASILSTGCSVIQQS